MRTLLHRLVDVACDAALEVYDLALDAHQWMQPVAAPDWSDVQVVQVISA